MMQRRHNNAMLALGSAAALLALSGSRVKEKPQMRRYSKPLGPPHPESRQHKRAMQRMSDAALARLTPTGDKP